MISKAIGIDLGTSNSIISYFDGKVPKVILNDYGEASMPSKVILLKDGRYCVGREAIYHSQRFESHSFTLGSVKRKIQDSEGFIINKKRFYPEAITALILSNLKKQAEKRLSTRIDEAVICIPCNYGVIQRQATIESASMAGIRVLRIVNESTAAAVGHSFLAGKDNEKELIFDLGAGTLDLSVIEFSEGCIQVLSTEGAEFLGGDDFDNRIIKYIIDETRKSQGFDPIEDQPWEMRHIAKLRLKEAAEKAKIELSLLSSTRINIPFIRNTPGKVLHIDIELTHEKFEEISCDLIDEIIKHTDKICKVSSFDKFVLTGGASKIKCLNDKIRKRYKGFKFLDRDKELVALGASLCAGMINRVIKDCLVIDCAGRSIGLGLQENKYQKLILKDSVIPIQKRDTFVTTVDNQHNIKLSVYEGENEKADLNRKVMDLEFGPLDIAKAGEIKVEVSFNLDVNNVLTINAQQLQTEVEREKEVEKAIPVVQPTLEKLKFWKEPTTKLVKSKETYMEKIPGKNLDKFNIKSPYISLKPNIKNSIKELLSNTN